MFHEYDIWLMIIPAALLTRYVFVHHIKPVGKIEYIIVVTAMFLLNVFLFGVFLGIVRQHPHLGFEIGNHFLKIFQ